ncbi:MAG: flagellar hook assembly protein FlgD [Synergistaceae bacterium]|nr:flagellar hook assembly protein FlgD [Synergistaceae bacterium]
MPVTYTNNYTDLTNLSVTNTTTTQSQSTTSTNSTSSTSKSSATTATTNELGKDAFLKLLIAELSNQDPLNPVEDREFISQMATFSSLEQMQNMNSTLTSMSEASKFSAVSYVGKAIAFTNDDGKQVAAKVNAIWFENGKTILDTTEGDVPLEKVEGISELS